MQKWTITTKDGQSFEVDEGILKLSQPLETQWEAISALLPRAGALHTANAFVSFSQRTMRSRKRSV